MKFRDGLVEPRAHGLLLAGLRKRRLDRVSYVAFQCGRAPRALSTSSYSRSIEVAKSAGSSLSMVTTQPSRSKSTYGLGWSAKAAPVSAIRRRTDFERNPPRREQFDRARVFQRADAMTDALRVQQLDRIAYALRLRPPRRRAQRSATPANARRQKARRRAARESAASSPPSDNPTTSRSVIVAIARAVSIALSSPKFRVRSGKSLKAARGTRSPQLRHDRLHRRAYVERGIEERPNRRRNEKLAIDDALGNPRLPRTRAPCARNRPALAASG